MFAFAGAGKLLLLFGRSYLIGPWAGKLHVTWGRFEGEPCSANLAFVPGRQAFCTLALASLWSRQPRYTVSSSTSKHTEGPSLPFKPWKHCKNLRVGQGSWLPPKWKPMTLRGRVWCGVEIKCDPSPCNMVQRYKGDARHGQYEIWRWPRGSKKPAPFEGVLT